MSQEKGGEKIMLETINNYIWNSGLLILLLGTGIFLTLKTKFFQLRRSGFIFKSVRRSLKNSGSSQWKISASALAASMGTGNIVGVTAAIAIGGAGAVFWMQVSAFFGMMLTYAENVLSMKFRHIEEDGNVIGGAAAYLRYGLGSKSLAYIYVFFCILASLGMGNMTQGSAAAQALSGAFGFSPVVVGVFITVFLLATVIGGAKSIGNAAKFLLPFAAISYMILALSVIFVNFKNIPYAFGEIFKSAFGIKQVGAGLFGSALSAGLRHGVFSNEAGLGSSALIHSNAEDSDPYLQGMWSIFEVFLDTMVCCTLTALMILTSGVNIEMGAKPVSDAFSIILGKYSGAVTSVIIALFAVCTMLGWFCCGETALKSLGINACKKKSVILTYRIIFCLLGGFGCTGALFDMWTLSDIANGLMAIPNLLALLLLSRYVTIPIKRDECGK